LNSKRSKKRQERQKNDNEESGKT